MGLVVCVLVTHAVHAAPTAADNDAAYRREAARFQQHVDAKAWDKALASLERSVPAATAAHGRNSEEVFDLLFKRAELLTMFGRYGDAIGAMEEALVVCRELPGTSGVRLAEVLARMAAYHVAAKDLAGQQRALKRAVEALEADKGGEVYLAPYLLRYGATLSEPGPERIAIAERGVKLLRKYGGERSIEIVQALTQLANAQHADARYFEARNSYEAALALADDIVGTRVHPQVAVLLGQMSRVYADVANHVREVEVASEALEVAQKLYGEEHVETAMARIALAGGWLARGDVATARRLAERALADLEHIFGPDHHWVTAALSMLTFVEASDGHIDRAKALAERGLAIRRAWYGEDDTRTITLQSHLAFLLLEHGQWDAAFAVDAGLRAVAERTFGRNHVLTVDAIERTAIVEHVQGRHAKAAELFDEVAVQRVRLYGERHPDTSRAVRNQVYAAASTGDYSAALRHQDRCNRIIDELMRDVLGAGTEEQKREYASMWHEETDATLSLHLAHMPDEPQAAELAFRTILGRKGRALDAMADRVAAVRDQADAPSRALLDQLLDARTLLAGMLMGGRVPADAAEAQRERIRALETAISARGTTLRAESEDGPTPGKIRAALPADAALVELALYRSLDFRKTYLTQQPTAHYAAYVLTKGGRVHGVRLGEAAAIDAKVGALRRAMLDPNAAYQPLARELYDLLWAPLEQALGGASEVIVSPDGLLSLLPFAALIDASGRHLIERARFSYLSSGRDMLRERLGSARQEAVLVGGPDYGASGGDGAAHRGAGMLFSPLPGTREEVTVLGKRMPQAIVLTGASATEESLKRVHGPRLLHLATHGFFLAGDGGISPVLGMRAATIVRRAQSDAPLDALLGSGLAFAGANGGPAKASPGGTAQDGLLTAYEASALDLRGTELVVLSGCDTGVGSVGRGEGVFGLRRALELAGAETLVMSLWRVGDEETRDLMAAYYDRLLAGAGRSDAMHAAQLALLADPKTAHPHHWAAFIVSGDPTPLSSASQPNAVAPSARGCACALSDRDTAPRSLWWLALGLAAVGRSSGRRRCSPL